MQLEDKLKNIQVQRDIHFTSTDTRNNADNATNSKQNTVGINTLYFIGWGKDGQLQGDELTREELQALHGLIGRALRAEAPQRNVGAGEYPGERRFDLRHTTTYCTDETSEEWNLSVRGSDYRPVSAEDLTVGRDFLTNVLSNFKK